LEEQIIKVLKKHAAVASEFVMDALVSGRRFRILTVVDDFTQGIPGRGQTPCSRSTRT
jgi:hypothetical protein